MIASTSPSCVNILLAVSKIILNPFSFNLLIPFITSWFGVDNPNLEELNFSRQFNPSLQNKKEPNIVIIILETFPAFKCGILGNPLNPTPNFDALANESILFSRFYVPKLSTAAAIFSTLTGLPDMAIINKSSNGQTELRVFVKTKIIFFNKEHEIELSLTNRSEMKYPILVGRKFLKNKFLVDVSKKHLSNKEEN